MYLVYLQHYYLVTDRVPEIRRAMGSTHFSTAFPKPKDFGYSYPSPIIVSHNFFNVMSLGI